MRRLNRFLPRSRRVLIPLATVVLLIVLVGGYVMAYAMPRSRADQMITNATPSITALNTALGQVSAAVAQQKTLYAQSRVAMTGDLARQLQLNARDGRLAAQDALGNLWRIMLVVNSYGRSVQIGGIPVIMEDSKVAFARSSLTGNMESWEELEEALLTLVLLFDQAEKTAPIMRDFIPYQPEVDLGTHVDLSTKPVVLLRADRTLSALDMSITQISQLRPPEDLWDAQERWLKQFVISRALLTELQQYVIAEDFAGADERVAPYARAVHDLQEDMNDTVEQIWSRVTAAETVENARGWMPPIVAFVGGGTP